MPLNETIQELQRGMFAEAEELWALSPFTDAGLNESILDRQGEGPIDSLYFLLASEGIKRANYGSKDFEPPPGFAEVDIEHHRASNELEITEDQLNDGFIALHGKKLPVMDVATAWANDQAKSAVYYKRRLWLDLLQAGTTEIGFDEVPFFSANHPTLAESGGTYNNVHNGRFTADGWNPIRAAIRKAKGSHGIAMGMLPKVVYVPSIAVKAANDLFQNKVVSSPEGAPIENVWQGSLGAPGLSVVEVPELGDNEAYVYADHPLGSKIKPLIYSEREGFSINEYGPLSSHDLAVFDKARWVAKMRVGMAYGVPYKMHKITLANGSWGKD